MMQLNEHVDRLNPLIRTKKNFVYKGKKYPIDFSLVKRYSNYFYENRYNYKEIYDIELNTNNYEISEESIRAFIACCQKEPFDINDENIIPLHQLSILYDVPDLIKLTSQYIVKNEKSIIFQSINYKLENPDSIINFDLNSLEDTIASNFFDYINDERLLSLPVQIIYQIINNEKLNIKSMDSTNQNLFFEFLFKCLDKHQRDASVLFVNLDLENERTGVLIQLLSRYSDVFDFNFINPKYLAKNASFLLSELQKQKIEFDNKIAKIELENKKQRDFFISAQKSINDSKRTLEEKVADFEKKLHQMEMKMNEQSNLLERYKQTKVEKIKINCDPQFLKKGSTMALTTSIIPEFAYNDGVEWQIIQDIEGTVNVESKNEKSLVLKCLKTRGKVKVVATALDGSGAKAIKEISISPFKVEIEVNVQQDQTIKGRIKVTEEENDTKLMLDKMRSKYILNTDSSENLGWNAYEDGYKLDSLDKEILFSRTIGQYYLHVLVMDNNDFSQEFVSHVLQTKGVKPLCFGFTGSAQSIVLYPGSYKLEAWGAQGGSYNSTYHGGYGGYATGIITLSSKTTLYVVVGKSTDSFEGGYNGGGSGGFCMRDNSIFTSYGGGGASHIGFKSGELATFSGDYSSNLLIVAGGGGGSGGTDGKSSRKFNMCGGNGGGFVGADGSSYQGSKYAGTGGTQTSAGKNNSGWKECGLFGHGSDCGEHPYAILGSGGGGGFYGGGSGGNAGTGGGGSGYINTSKLKNAFMYGYEVSASSSAETKTFSTTNVNPEAVSNSAKQNDGYAKISIL